MEKWLLCCYEKLCKFVVTYVNMEMKVVRGELGFSLMKLEDINMS